MAAPYTVEVVVKGSLTRVVSVHETAALAHQGLRNLVGVAVVRNAAGRVMGSTLARSSGNLRSV